MALSLHCSFIFLAAFFPLGRGEEIAFGDIAADGSSEIRSLDVPVAMASGADNFFISNPMDSHDWSHTKVVRNTLFSEIKAQRAGSNKVARLEEALKPIYAAMPKDAAGKLSNGTARYALHRFFNEKHGWAIKGLQPAGAAWRATMSVTPDVKDVTKYMVPSYLQQLLSDELNLAGFDLHSLALLAASLEHLIHAETVSTVYDTLTTLGLPVAGRRNEREVNEVLDTFLMVHVFGMNLEASMLEDVQKAKAYLESSHSAWPRLRALAQQVKQESAVSSNMDFAEMVQVVTKISEGYVRWQAQDCRRVKDELTAKPSHKDGRVKLSEVQPSHVAGQRSLFTENTEDLEKLGVLRKGANMENELIVANYVNSQSMCLSTAGFHTACCVNECEGLLSKLERDVAGPAADPSQLERLMSALPGVSPSLLKEIHSLADKESGLVQLHSRALAEWMHKAFPLECPAPNDHKVTNPKTPDEWIGDTSREVAELEEMMTEISEVLARYTAMGEHRERLSMAEEEEPDSSKDVVTLHAPVHAQQQPKRHVISTIFHIAAVCSMVGMAAVGAKSGLSATGVRGGKKIEKDFV